MSDNAQFSQPTFIHLVTLSKAIKVGQISETTSFRALLHVRTQYSQAFISNPVVQRVQNDSVSLCRFELKHRYLWVGPKNVFCLMTIRKNSVTVFVSRGNVFDDTNSINVFATLKIDFTIYLFYSRQYNIQNIFRDVLFKGQEGNYALLMKECIHAPYMLHSESFPAACSLLICGHGSHSLTPHSVSGWVSMRTNGDRGAGHRQEIDLYETLF